MRQFVYPAIPNKIFVGFIQLGLKAALTPISQLVGQHDPWVILGGEGMDHGIVILWQVGVKTPWNQIQ